jgi:hypothetical protein
VLNAPVNKSATSNPNCSPTNGRVEVCNAAYSGDQNG